jgi:hypothetical protein
MLSHVLRCFDQLRTQALASLHSGLQNNQGLPVAHGAKWLAMEVLSWLDEFNSINFTLFFFWSGVCRLNSSYIYALVMQLGRGHRKSLTVSWVLYKSI